MLTAHRTAAIHAELMNRPEVALAALVHWLVLQVFGSRYVSNRIVQISIEKIHLKPDAGGHRAEPRRYALEQKRQYWKEKIEAAGQGCNNLIKWLLEQDSSPRSWQFDRSLMFWRSQ